MGKKHRPKKKEIKPAEPQMTSRHWDTIIIVLLFVIPLIYFSGFLTPNKMIGGSDFLNGSYPFEKWTAEQEEMPLWYPHVFSGFPVLGSPSGGPLTPFAQLREILPPHVVLVIIFIVAFFLGGLGTYLYLKEIGVSRYAAAVGAVAFQFIGNLATAPEAGHGGRAFSIAVFPLMLFLLHRGYQTRKLIYFLLFSLVTAWAFYDGHFQMTYYVLLAIIGYTIYYLVIFRKAHKAKDVGQIILYGFISVIAICVLMAATWLPVLGGLGAGARGVARGYAYATSWAMPALELIDLVIPTYSGLLDNYWGFNHFKIHMEYFGMFSLVMALFTIALCWKRRFVKFFSVQALVVLFVVLGSATPIFRVFYTLIPGFRLFRAPALAFFLISFAFVVLGSIGFDELVMKSHREARYFNKRAVYILGGVIIGALLITALICMAGKSSIIEAMQNSFRSRFVSEVGAGAAHIKLTKVSANFSSFVSGIWRSLLFAAITFAMIVLSAKKHTRVWIYAVIAAVVICVDQMPLVARYLPSAPAPRTYYAAGEEVSVLKRDTGLYRVFPTPWYAHAKDSYLLYHNIQSVGGYIPNPLKRYQEFIGAGASVMYYPMKLLQNHRFVDLLSCKYVISPTLPEDLSHYNAQEQRMIAEIKQYLSRYTLLLHGRQNSVFFNEYAFPRAYLVGDYQVAKEDEVLALLASPVFDPRNSVVLEDDPGMPHPDSSLPIIEAEMVSYMPNEVVCRINAPFPGLFVLVDNWHPDWKVFVDGEARPLYQANYIFRAVYVDKGMHEVVFKYISPYFNAGKIISPISLIVVVGLVIVLSVLRTKSLKKPEKSV
jgi:hypothetical protein